MKNSKTKFKRYQKTKLSMATAFALSLPLASQAELFNVNEATDDGTGLVENSLSWAILQANSNNEDDVIQLNTDVTITGVMKRLVDSNITIQSDNIIQRTINGGDQFRPLFIKSGQVIIKDLIVSNGQAKGGNANIGGAGAGLGGAIFMYDGQVALKNVTVTNSLAKGGDSNCCAGTGGGGLFGSSHTGGGGLFATASSTGGAYGGYGNYQDNDVLFGQGGNGYDFNTIDGNGLAGGFGGGGGRGQYGNGGHGGFGGGGGWSYNYDEPLTQFGGNGGFGAGGGTAHYNNATQAGQPGYGGSGKSAAGFGGALFVRAGSLSLINTTFSNNQAQATNQAQGLGGALFVMHTTENPNGNNQGMPDSLSQVVGCGVSFINNNAESDTGEMNNNDDLFDLANLITPLNGVSITEPCSAEPEIYISANQIEIIHGDDTPDLVDGTDFGSALEYSDPISHSFMVSNFGATALQLNGNPVVNIENDPDNQFSITLQPTQQTIELGEFVSFEVTFLPTVIGSHLARVSISNNDADESPYEFTIKGDVEVDSDLIFIDDFDGQ